MKARVSDFHNLLESLSEPFSHFSIISPEDSCLYIKTTSPQLCLGLMQGPQTLKSFFTLDEGSIYFHNEPNFGCIQFGCIQFVFSESGFVFSLIKKFELPWKMQDDIKLPPFPLVEKGKLNEFIFSSINSIPQAPSNLTEEIKSTLKDIQIFCDRFKILVKSFPDFFTKELFKKYLSDCANEARFKIKQKVFTQANSEIIFLNNEALKTKLTTDELGIKIDFQGTLPSSQIALSDMTTDSLCFSMLSHYFQFSHKMNSATFALFQITKPATAFVSSKSKMTLLKSDYWGIPLLKSALHQCLWKMYGKNQTAPHNYFSLPVELKTVSGKYLQFNLPNGRAFYLQNNYNQDKGYFQKNNSDGTLLPMISAFEVLGCQIVSLEERTLKSPKGTLNSSPGWSLKIKSTDKLILSYFPDISSSHSKQDKTLTTFEASKIIINGKEVTGCYWDLEIPEDSEVVFKSGYSSSVI